MGASSSSSLARAASEFSRRGFIWVSVASLFVGLTMKIRCSLSSEKPRASAVDVGPNGTVEHSVVGSGASGVLSPAVSPKPGARWCCLRREVKMATMSPRWRSSLRLPLRTHKYNGTTSSGTYEYTAQQKRDRKYVINHDGVWYPRVGALCGCTLHSFLAGIYRSNSNWDHIAELTDDLSWNVTNMRQYFERLE
jgi:choline dehydrogenase